MINNGINDILNSISIDIGVDPILAGYETQRPFWRLSEHHAAAFRRWLDSREAA